MDFLTEDKSRTQKKNEDRGLQKLGERLLTFSKDQLFAMDIPDELKDAVNETRKIRSHTARQRQIQYIGVLMRNIDTAPIHKAIEFIEAGLSLKTGQKQDSMPERWVEALVSGDDAVVEDVMTTYPSAERQKLRQLVRNARKVPKSSSQLLNYIRSLENE